jgi:hypothetical protein
MPTPQPYRKKPVVINAMQWTHPSAAHDLIGWAISVRGRVLTYRPDETGPAARDDSNWGRLTVATLEGEHVASPGDWLIQGVAGEFYFCKDDIFRATYEPAGEVPA